MLVERLAQATLREVAPLPGEEAPGVQRVVGVAPATSRQRGGEFVREMFVSLDALDWLGVEHGRWAEGEALRRCIAVRDAFENLPEQSGGQVGGTRQGASGGYQEVGHSCLPGAERTSYAGSELGRSHTPYEGAPALSDALESVVADYLELAAEALAEWWPEVAEQYEHLASQSPAARAVADALQWPRGGPGQRRLRGCQVALRRSGFAGGAVAEHAFRAGADLHVDYEDADPGCGSAAVYTCWGDTAGASDPEHPLPYSDVACFPLASGGVGGLRHVTMHPRYMCILLMHTRTSLHGSVFPDDAAVAATTLPRGLRTARVIHYPLRGTESAVLHAAEGGREAAEALLAALDRQRQSRRLAERLRTALVAHGV